MIKKRAAEREANPAEWEQRLKTEAEQRTREKFASPVGRWTPVDRSRLPKLPGVEQINPLTSLETVKYPATLASQGTKTGERVLVQFEIKPLHLKTLADLGMRDKMQEQFQELLKRPKGFLLFSALPAGGLRTTIDVVLNGMDRFLREFAAVEDEGSRAREVENIAVTTYKAADGQGPAAVLPKVFRAEPNVVVVRDLPDADTVGLICRDVAESDRLIMGSMRAKDCAEALLRLLVLKAPPEEVAAAVSAVLCQRLVRKLCDLCKEPYAPAPQVLQQLGIPAGRVRAFYRPRQPKPDEGKKDLCRECGGIGYKGQTAIFELLVARRQRPQGAGRYAEVGFAPPGRPQGRHEKPSGRGHPAGRPRRHFAAGIDARDETMKSSLGSSDLGLSPKTEDPRPKAQDLFAMILTGILLMILLFCIGFLFAEGMWSNALRFITVVAAALLATNYFEPVADQLDAWLPSYTYCWDFVALWGLFAVFVVLFRAMTDQLSKVKVRFPAKIDQAGSVVFSALVGWVMVCFTLTTLHTAPLGEKFCLRLLPVRPADVSGLRVSRPSSG